AAPAVSSAEKQCCSPRTPRYCIRCGIIPKVLGWLQWGNSTDGGAVTSSSMPRKTNQSARAGASAGGWMAAKEPGGHSKGRLIRGSRDEPAGRSGTSQPTDQARGVPAPPAHLRDLVVVACDRLRNGERGSVLARGFRADAQILAHPVDGEAEVE